MFKGFLMEAKFYERQDKNAVKCRLCSHRCQIEEGNRGICGVRENKKGALYSLVYGRIVSRGIDPIEKKPLFHFQPGSMSYSIATVGCNFKCENCQNWEISQSPKPNKPIMGGNITPKEIVSAAMRSGSSSIAYTYSEPVIFMEYAYDTAEIAVKNGLKNVFVTNGYATEEAINDIAPFLHAANIDLKSMNDEFYKKNCGARLKPVLDSIKLHKKLGIWIEITTLIIPRLNDSVEELRNIAEFISSIGEEIPWHISRFYPAYMLIGHPPTPIETLRKAREIGVDSGLRYVYLGNVPGERENTYCYSCGKLLVERNRYIVVRNMISKSRCSYCGAEIDGVF